MTGRASLNTAALLIALAAIVCGCKSRQSPEARALDCTDRKTEVEHIHGHPGDIGVYTVKASGCGKTTFLRCERAFAEPEGPAKTSLDRIKVTCTPITEAEARRPPETQVRF